MHRDYETHTPTQVIRYSNRIEFRNAGYSLKPEEELGTEGSALRNPALARVLHQTRLAETKGSGIATMRETMREADLTPPTFFSSREHNRFVVTLLMLHVLEPEALAWLAHFDDLGLSREDRQALVFARETGEIRNEDYRNLNSVDTLTASMALRRLRDLNLLTQHDKGSATYYTPTTRLINPAVETDQAFGEKTPVESEKRQEFAEKRQDLSGQRQEFEQKKDALPPDLLQALDAWPGWSAQRKLREMVLRLCQATAWTAEELARLVDRKQEYLVRKHLTPMVRDGLLVRERPSPHDPNQTYRAADAAE